MPSINFFYSRRFVNAKRETAERFTLLKNDCFCKTELIIAGFVSLCKTFFNFYSHRFAVSAHIQPFLRRFSHFKRSITHFMGFICFFSSEGLTFCMIMQDFAFDSILHACENALSTCIVKKRGCQANSTDISRVNPSYLRPKVSKGRSESPLVGRWGKAPYSKMLRYSFLEMFGLNLTASRFQLCVSTK